MNIKETFLASTKLMPLALVLSLTACHAQTHVNGVSVSSSSSTSSGPSGSTSSNVNVTTVDGKTFVNGHQVNIDTSQGVNITTVNGKTVINGQPLEALITPNSDSIDVKPGADKPGNNLNLSVNKDEDAEQGSGTPSSDMRNVKPFSHVDIAGSVDAEVKFGYVPSVRVELDDNLLDNINTTVDGDTLHVTTRHSYRAKSPAKLLITTVQPLKSVHHSGIGNISLNDAIAKDAFSVEVTGMGGVRAHGVVDKLKVTVSGVGQAHLDKLQARDATVELSGVGDAFVNVTGNLNAVTNGTGKVRYLGKPKIEHRGSGIGEVVPITE